MPRPKKKSIQLKETLPIPETSSELLPPAQVPDPPLHSLPEPVGKAEKVKPTTKTIYNLDECIRYIIKVYELDPRDWNKKYKIGSYDPKLPYQDFWNVLLTYGVAIGINSFFEMPYHWLEQDMVKEESNKWIATILELFKKEFTETTSFYVSG